MTIKVRIKNVYGNELIYPICDNAKSFSKLAGKKTLSREDIATIKTLGFSVLVEPEKL